ncbi:MAG: hypothetical protein ABJF11_06660 [Reichenbachiella sp.]|uniref:hypothetical protein n=1 Tax=Reichenbachiella sp. TaxID=2184521 RepID=UPI003263A738
MKEIDKNTLTQTRKSLHQAIQLVSAVPRNILPHDPTDGRSSLEWNSQLNSLQSLPVTNSNGEIRVGLTFETFALYITVNDDSKAALEMSGRSVNEGLIWMKQELAKIDIASEAINLDLPYEIEKYDYSKALYVDTEALNALAELYQTTAEVLSDIVNKWEDAHDIRCWPHHFDLATLIPLETDQNKEITKSIGIGLSPGDDSINEPYLYVNIWPQVDSAMLQKHDLVVGEWNLEDWSGAILRYSSMNLENLKVEFESFTGSVIPMLQEEKN